MSEIIKKPNDSIAGEYFKVTPNLRWEKRWEGRRWMSTLQQLHQGSMGTTYWEDVPTVKQLSLK